MPVQFELAIKDADPSLIGKVNDIENMKISLASGSTLICRNQGELSGL